MSEADVEAVLEPEPVAFYTPPFKRPRTLASMMYRDDIVYHSLDNGLFVLLPLAFCGWALALGLTDPFAAQCYDNWEAIGSQIHPEGIFKYYDMFSLDGIMTWGFDYIFVYYCHYFSFLTLGIPISWFVYIDQVAVGALELDPLFPVITQVLLGVWFNQLFGLELEPNNFATF